MSENPISSRNVHRYIHEGDWAYPQFNAWLEEKLREAMRKQRGSDAAVLKAVASQLPMHGERNPFA